MNTTIKKTQVIALQLILLISLVLVSYSAVAHPPSSMELNYHMDNETLEVTMEHSVTDPENHYMENVTVMVNDETIINETYTSQPANEFTYTYDVTAEEGDTIEVYSLCNQGGDITEQITVTAEEEPGANETDGTNQTDGANETNGANGTDGTTDTPGFELIGLVAAVGVIVIILYKRKQ